MLGRRCPDAPDHLWFSDGCDRPSPAGSISRDPTTGGDAGSFPRTRTFKDPINIATLCQELPPVKQLCFANFALASGPRPSCPHLRQRLNSLHRGTTERHATTAEGGTARAWYNRRDLHVIRGSTGTIPHGRASAGPAPVAPGSRGVPRARSVASVFEQAPRTRPRARCPRIPPRRPGRR